MISFSFVVPVYNTGKYLPECLKSLLRQSTECEILLVDDGSTDGVSAELCDDYAAKHECIRAFIQKIAVRAPQEITAFKKPRAITSFWSIRTTMLRTVLSMQRENIAKRTRVILSFIPSESFFPTEKSNPKAANMIFICSLLRAVRF